MVKAVSLHGLPVSSATPSGCGKVAAVDVHDAAVAETDQVVDRQPGAALVSYSYNVNAVSGKAPSDVDDGHLIGDASELCGHDRRPGKDHRLAPVGE
jgi:hypothetical protein